MDDISLLKENSRLMDLVHDDLNFKRNIGQKNIARMANQPNRMVIQFQGLNAEKGVFTLEFGKRDPYNAVVDRVAQKLRVDPRKIRLTGHNCGTNKPLPNHIDTYSAGCLFDIVKSSYKICNVLYYEVLDAYQPDMRHMKTLKVSYGYLYEKEISVTLPEHTRVRDLLNDIRKDVVVLTNSNAELCLLGIYDHKIFTVFPLEEKIEDIPKFSKLQVEAIPEEKNLGPGHHLIHVYHFTKKPDGETSLKTINSDVIPFGKPFLFVIHDCETLAEVKVRIQEKLSVENEEFSKWKFTLLRVGRLKYLEDSDVVSNCFEGGEDNVLVQCLGLEHSIPIEISNDDELSMLFPVAY